MLNASVVEWSITIDCKSIALRASLVQIQPGAHENLNATVNTVAFRFLLRIVNVDLNRGRLVNRAVRPKQPAESGCRFRVR